MSHKLTLHTSQQSIASAKLIITSDASVQGHSLVLSYTIESPLSAPKIVWTKADTSFAVLSPLQRKDELWKTTCLEAFMLFEGGRYIEFNFAPSGEWNAYHFDSYREGMKPESRLGAVTDFESKRSDDRGISRYELSVRVGLAQTVNSSQHFRLGLTSVIETDAGERSYWSLKHSGEKPDFHDSRGHILDMRVSRVTT